MPILLYGRFAQLILIPNLITLIMMTVTKSFSGPHDYFSKTYVAANKDLMIPERRIAFSESEVIDLTNNKG
ncbi:MAG: hypothetical protein WC282_01460 [Bacilli bacterium]